MEHKKTEYSLVKVLIGTVVGITGLIYLGLLTGFFPFGCFGENIAARVISYCTVILCAECELFHFIEGIVLNAIAKLNPIRSILLFFFKNQVKGFG